MILKVIYHYAEDDTTFSSDCYDCTVTIDGGNIELPFEEDYPQSYTQAFVAGIMLLNKNIQLEEQSIADIEI